jgi:hypothetical protein
VTLSTKSTLAHGDDFHIYQEIGDSQNVYVQLKTERGLISLSHDHLTFALPPEFLTLLSEAWLRTKDKFDSRPLEVDSQALIDFLEAFEDKK